MTYFFTPNITVDILLTILYFSSIAKLLKKATFVFTDKSACNQIVYHISERSRDNFPYLNTEENNWAGG